MKVGEKKEKKREANRAREKCRGPNMCVIGIYFDVKHDLLALLMSSSASSFAWCIVYPISTVRVARLLPWRMTKQLIDLLHVWRCWCILTATTAIIKNKHTCSLFDAIRCGWCAAELFYGSSWDAVKENEWNLCFSFFAWIWLHI